MLSQDSKLKPFKPPATIFVLALEALMVDIEVEYLCLGSGGSDTARVSMSNSGCGIRVQLTASSSWALTRWLKRESLHGYILKARDFAVFLDFGFPQIQKTKSHLSPLKELQG
jgi:hypothetical protein